MLGEKKALLLAKNLRDKWVLILVKNQEIMGMHNIDLNEIIVKFILAFPCFCVQHHRLF